MEDLLAALSPEEVSHLVDEMAADPDDKHMPASARSGARERLFEYYHSFILWIFVRTAYRCEKEATGELNRDTLINYINEIALNTPDAEEKVKFEPGKIRGKQYVPKYTEAESADMEKAESGQVRLDPEEEAALSNATLNDIMALADILNTNPQDFVMEAYADPLQYFEPDPPNTTNPKEILEKLNSNDKETKDVNLNNVSGISEQLFCDIFNAIKNNDQITKLSACNCDVSNAMTFHVPILTYFSPQLSDFAVQTLCSVMDQNSSLKSLSIENNLVSPDVIADLFEAAASPNNGLVEMRVAAQQQEKMGQRVEERIAAAICKNPR